MENNNFYIDFLDLINDCYFENHYYFDDSLNVLFKNIDLPIIKYKYLNDKLRKSNEECLISLHKFNNDDDVILLPCDLVPLRTQTSMLVGLSSSGPASLSRIVSTRPSLHILTNCISTLFSETPCLFS